MIKLGKIFWGLFFITAGAFVTLDQIYHYTNINLLSLLLTIFIVAILIKSLFRISFTGILFSLAFLCIIYSEPLHLESITPIPVLLTALLGSIGLSILFNRHYFYKKCSYVKYNHNSDDYSEVVDGIDGENVDFSVNCSSSIKYINSDDFKKANLRCHLGSMKVYFDKAKIKGDDATINLDVSFSGVELYIPKEWKVVNKVNVSLGGVEEKNTHGSKQEKTITLTGNVNLSGVEIIFI
jgi:predicted membrane protein